VQNKLGVFDRVGKQLSTYPAPGGSMVDVATLDSFRMGSAFYDTLVGTSNNVQNVINFWRVTDTAKGQLADLDPANPNPPVFRDGRGAVSALALGRYVRPGPRDLP
jgi:hypothetical protein